jgi:hypothetical protein
MAHPKTYCCKEMKRQCTRTCEMHPEPFDCADSVVFRANEGWFGIMIHDGGTSGYRIKYCPWCGSKLPIRVEPKPSAGARSKK